MIEPGRYFGYHNSSRQSARLHFEASLLVYEYKGEFYDRR